AINSFHRKGGHIRKRVPVIKFFATVLTMGSGGSGGAEGPIAQIGAGFGSFIADRLKLGPREKRLLMISGVGAGVGAIFQVPLAGAIFAAEVLYSDPDIETDAIIPACVCSIVAYCVYGAWHGFGHMFPVSGMSFQNPLELLPYLLLALLVTGGALLYIWVFYGTEGAFNRLRLPFIVKPLIGGLMTGATALALLLIVGDEHVIDVMSTGYGILQDALSGQIVEIGVLILLAVAIGKIFTTSFSIASGGSAGVFGPSLVIGGTLGGAAGLVFQGWWPGLVQNPSSFAMVGMAGFFAAAANTPLSAVIMVSEMTGDYSLLVPAVWVCAITFLASRRWTIFRSQAESRLHSPAHIGQYAFEMMGKAKVGEVFKENRRFVPVEADLPLTRVLGGTGSTRQRIFPVMDHGRLVGVFHYKRLMAALESAQEHPEVMTARSLMRPVSVSARFPGVRAGDPLSVAQRKMTGLDVEELIVVSDEMDEVIGILTASDVLLAYNRRLADLSAERHAPNILPPLEGDHSGDELESESIVRAAMDEKIGNTNDRNKP
ncbi:MAG TPA: chloride channel protein, partial [Myxococcota bacterium]|nr:chloride channel protein [Myxococcota bacterium]